VSQLRAAVLLAVAACAITAAPSAAATASRAGEPHATASLRAAPRATARLAPRATHDRSGPLAARWNGKTWALMRTPARAVAART